MKKRQRALAFIAAIAVVSAVNPAEIARAQAGNPTAPQIGTSFLCPEKLASDAERRESLDTFLKAYAAQHPNATVRDVMLARDRLLVSNGCTQTLQYMLAHIAPIAQMVRFNDRSYDRSETEFDAKTHVWTVYFDPEGSQLDRADRGLIFNFYSWDPPTAAADIASAWANNKGSATNIYTFQAPDSVTKQPAYFIVSETIHPDRGYGYANISKVSSVGNGAYAVTYDQKFAGKDATDIELKIRSWLLGADAKKIESDISSVGVDIDWQNELTKSH